MGQYALLEISLDHLEEAKRNPGAFVESLSEAIDRKSVDSPAKSEFNAGGGTLGHVIVVLPFGASAQVKDTIPGSNIEINIENNEPGLG